MRMGGQFGLCLLVHPLSLPPSTYSYQTVIASPFVLASIPLVLRLCSRDVLAARCRRRGDVGRGYAKDGDESRRARCQKRRQLRQVQ